MQQDIHYYAIGVLAKAAGFSQQDALTIAYASQYVDNATEGDVIKVKSNDVEYDFEPARTAYDPLRLNQGLQSSGWSAQKRVWIPFHFLPPRPFDPARPKFSYVTEPDSPLSKMLLERAASEPREKRRLCRIGVALHTYADTFSHQRFSGRKSQHENDVETICLWNEEKGDYDKLKIENILLDALPWVGHAEAGVFPDLTYLKWKYNSRQSSEPVERDNTATFLTASKAIYDWLCTIAPGPPVLDWEGEEGLGARVHKVLIDQKYTPGSIHLAALLGYRRYHELDLKKRCENWQNEFSSMFDPPESFSYDPKEWRENALEGDTDWEDWDSKDWSQMTFSIDTNTFWDSLWVHFHRAVLLQRHFVLENLP
jgi:hypothetical protein